MLLISSLGHKKIDSSTCGSLTELLNQRNVPISIIELKDIRPTKRHAHKNSTEIYWVKHGQIEIEVEIKSKKETVNLTEGSLLILKPKEFHSVIKASETNEVVVLSTPPWTQVDEIH